MADDEFYEKLESDPNPEFADNINHIIQDMKNNNYVTNKENKFLTEDLKHPRTPVFYGLPKIHKIFDKIPPFRPIVSGYKSCSTNLSQYIDSFLKFQAKHCESFIKDTKDFLIKLKSIEKVPENSILVTMDVSSLYTNIDHTEGAEACYNKLKKRKNKSVPSTLLKKLILIVLRCNVFRFGSSLYRQKKGTAMGTSMAPNYANIFMDMFEQKLLNDFQKKTGMKPLIWVRFIDIFFIDIFFIWTHGHDNLQHFLEYAQTYSEKKKLNQK